MIENSECGKSTLVAELEHAHEQHSLEGSNKSFYEGAGQQTANSWH